MASAIRKSSSFTDAVTLKQKIRSYGFSSNEKQSYMLTPFDLSECVGLQNYPKEPLGPLFPDESLFDLGRGSLIRRRDRKQGSPTKV